MFATLLLVRLIRKSRQDEEAFRFNKSEFNTISCFKGSLRFMEIEGAFQYKKVDFLQVGAENDGCARLICQTTGNHARLVVKYSKWSSK